jgi:hypothetical protein
LSSRKNRLSLLRWLGVSNRVVDTTGRVFPLAK